MAEELRREVASVCEKLISAVKELGEQGKYFLPKFFSFFLNWLSLA